jgi:hypothetical protein
MGFLEILLILLVIAAIYGRGYLALGVIFDFFIALLVIWLLYRIILILF